MSDSRLGRHDDPEEQAQDQLRADIRANHRFSSFAGERSANTVKWYGRPRNLAMSLLLCLFWQACRWA